MNNQNEQAKILKVICIDYHDDGKLYACAQDGWLGGWSTGHELVQSRIFSRDNVRVKVLVYHHVIPNLDTWGKMLVGALVDGNKAIWKHVELSDCDR